MLLTVEEIEEILQKSLSHVLPKEIKKAAEAVVSASGKWQELDLADSLGAQYSCQCRDICGIGNAHAKGLKIRAFISER